MRSVLVNGGSRGIGKEIVTLLSSRGYRVAFTYKNSSECAEELSAKTGALAIRADSAVEADVLRAVETVREHFGSIDCLVNNAGISSFSLFTDITLDAWNEMMNVNLTSVFLYSKAVLPDMIKKKWGRIVNISSMWGLCGASCEVHYSTAKAGVIGLTKALAKEVGPSGITVNAIAPGLIRTDMNSSLSEEDRASVIEETPLMREGETSDVASAVAFLLSDEASFITGDCMNVSGGYVI